MVVIKNPDLWLKTAADLVIRDFLEPAGYTDVKVPPIRFGTPCIEIMCSSGAETQYDAATSEMTEMIIAAQPVYGPPNSGEKIAMYVAHEMIHVAISPKFVDRDDHASPEFLALHEKMGLEGDAHASKIGPAFMQWVDDVLAPEYERRAAQ
jgi:hypothetical protein